MHALASGDTGRALTTPGYKAAPEAQGLVLNERSPGGRVIGHL
ncbi:hypothetical protein [Archangium violaceum]